MAQDAITIDDRYFESEDHVPNPADMNAQYNTSGLGAHQKIEEVSSVFEVDKVKVAEQIVGALNPDDLSVTSDRVLLPSVTTDNEVARDEILGAAEARLRQGVVIGGPTPAERGAEEEGSNLDVRAEAGAASGPAAAAAAAQRANVSTTGSFDDSTSVRSDDTVPSDADKSDADKAAEVRDAQPKDSSSADTTASVTNTGTQPLSGDSSSSVTASQTGTPAKASKTAAAKPSTKGTSTS